MRKDEEDHWHALGKTLFVQIIDGLNDVTEAYRGTKNADNSARRENYFLLVSQFSDKDGNEVNVPVYINEKGQYNNAFIDINKIATSFGRKQFRNYLAKEVAKGNLARIKNRNTTTSERPAPIAVRYGNDVSIENLTTQSKESQDKKSERGVSLTSAEENEVGKALYTLNKYTKKIRDYLSEIYDGTPSAKTKEFLLSQYGIRVNEDGEAVVEDDAGCEITLDDAEEMIREQENVVDSYDYEDEYDEEDLEYEKGVLDEYVNMRDRLERQNDILRNLKYAKNELYAIKQKIIDSLSPEVVNYHEFGDGKVRPLYKIGDYSFHGEATEGGYDENAVETLDNISADNELGEERIGIIDAIDVLKRYFDIKNSEVSSLSGEYAPSNMKFSSRDTAFSKALTAEEWKKYNNAMTSGVDAGLRINDRSMLVECEKGDYSYKLVIYDNEIEDKPIKAVYGIGNDDYSAATIHEISNIVTDMEDMAYGQKYADKILKSTAKVYNILLGRYNGRSFRVFGKSEYIAASGGNPQNQSDRGRISKTDTQSVKFSERDNSLTASEENEVGKALYTLNKYTKKIRDYLSEIYDGTPSAKTKGFLLSQYGIRVNEDGEAVVEDDAGREITLDDAEGMIREQENVVDSYEYEDEYDEEDLEYEKGDYSYKLVIYDNEIEDKPIKAVYGIAKSNQPTTNNNFDEKVIAEFLTEVEDMNYDNKQVLKGVLKSYSKNVKRVLGRYSGGSNGFVRYGREISQSGGNSQNQSDRGGISRTDTQSVKSSERGDTDSRTLLANALETAATSEAKTQNREQNERRQTPLFLYSHHFPL